MASTSDVDHYESDGASLCRGPGFFPFDYRMRDLPFLSRVLVALLDSIPACLCNDYGLVATGESVAHAVAQYPEWDWRRAEDLPEGSPDGADRH